MTLDELLTWWKDQEWRGGENASDVLNRGIDAARRLRLAVEALTEMRCWCRRYNGMLDLECERCIALREIEEGPKDATEQCDHNWVDARNSVVSSGEVCLRCNAIRAGDGPKSPTEKP